MTSLAEPEMVPPGGAEADPDFGFLFAPASTAVETQPRFRERLPARLRRLALGTAYALRLDRLHIVPSLLFLAAEFLISPEAAAARFEERRYRGSQGLVGVSQDLSPQALLDAYRSGIFPFCHVGPTKWWSPAERPVLHPGETRIEKNLRRVIRQRKYRVTFDTDFGAVMQACAEPRPGKTPLTWITPKVMKAFWDLHQAGHAHSVEVWDADGRLVGGLYGLAAGDVFFGESQFSTVRDASKVAVVTLHCHLAHWGFVLRDAKRQSEHLKSLGFRMMPRADFLDALREHAWKPGRPGRWAVDETLDVAAWQSKP